MKDIYGFIVKREKQENYGFPMELEQIDQLTTSLSEEELLQMVHESNIIPDFEESNPSLAIAKKRHNKWIEDKQTPIITDPFILSYELAEVFAKNISHQETFCNVLYSHLNYLLEKPYTSQEMKETILALKSSSQEFLTTYSKLSYPEKRKIKLLLATNFNIKELLNSNQNFELIRMIKEEKNAA